MQYKTKVVAVDGISITVTEKPIKNMHLSVNYTTGAVRASKPISASGASFSAFLESRVGWLRVQLERAQKHAPQRITANTVFQLFDETIAVKFNEGTIKKYERKDNVLLVTAPDTAWLSTAVKSFCRKAVVSQLKSAVPKWEAATGLKCSSWYVRDMSTRWGSCNTKTHRIAFNLKLYEKPYACLEYVVIHELGHILYPNHGDDFKRYLAKFCPDYLKVKRLLNS